MDKGIGSEIRDHVCLRHDGGRATKQNDSDTEGLDLIEPVDPIADTARVDAIDFGHVDEE